MNAASYRTLLDPLLPMLSNRCLINNLHAKNLGRLLENFLSNLGDDSRSQSLLKGLIEFKGGSLSKTKFKKTLFFVMNSKRLIIAMTKISQILMKGLIKIVYKGTYL